MEKRKRVLLGNLVTRLQRFQQPMYSASPLLPCPDMSFLIELEGLAQQTGGPVMMPELRFHFLCESQFWRWQPPSFQKGFKVRV